MTDVVLGLPWLAASILLPALAAAWCARLDDPRDARRLAIAVCGASLALALDLTYSACQLPREAFLVDPLRFGAGEAHPLLGLDPLSAPISLLMAVIALVCSLALPAAAATPAALARLLATLSSTLLALASRDLRLFALAWALGLAPLAWELRQGGSQRYAWTFVGYQGLGLVAFLVALGGLSGGSYTLGELHGPGPLLAGSLGLVVAVRQGLLPCHSWLPGLPRRGGAGATAMACAPQLGLYLLLRLEPSDALVTRIAEPLAVLAAASAVYGALLGLVQRDLRRGLGWLIASQAGLVATGVLSSSTRSLTGALLLWGACGLAWTGLLLGTEALKARFGPVDLKHPRELNERTPRLATLFLLLGLASVGLPGTLGFVSEDLLFHGTLETVPAAGLALVVATALNGFNVLRLSYRTFAGRKTVAPALPDLALRERMALFGLLALLIVGGFAPRRLVAQGDASANRLRAPADPAPPHAH